MLPNAFLQIAFPAISAFSAFSQLETPVGGPVFVADGIVFGRVKVIRISR